MIIMWINSSFFKGSLHAAGTTPKLLNCQKLPSRQIYKQMPKLPMGEFCLVYQAKAHPWNIFIIGHIALDRWKMKLWMDTLGYLHWKYCQTNVAHYGRAGTYQGARRETNDRFLLFCFSNKNPGQNWRRKKPICSLSSWEMKHRISCWLS